ncbi:MAG: hypothetical protein ACK4M8_02745 [Allorhizobium sp.]
MNAKKMQQLLEAECKRASLIDVIDQYRIGLARFNEHSYSDNDLIADYAARTYAPPMALLQIWSNPAKSYDEAIRALKLANDEAKQGCQAIATSMTKAALDYFDAPNSPSLLEKLQAVYAASEEIKAALRVITYALEERIDFFRDFATVDAGDALSLCEDIKAALRLPQARAVQMMELFEGISVSELARVAEALQAAEIGAVSGESVIKGK